MQELKIHKDDRFVELLNLLSELKVTCEIGIEQDCVVLRVKHPFTICFGGRWTTTRIKYEEYVINDISKSLPLLRFMLDNKARIAYLEKFSYKF